MTDQELAFNDTTTSTPSPAWEMINESTLTLDKLAELRRAAFQQVEHVDWLHEQVRKLSDTGGDQFRKAIGSWILGRHADALRLFKGLKDTPLLVYCAARSALALGKLDEAKAAHQKISKSHGGSVEVVALGLQVLERGGDWDALKKAVDGAKALDATAWAPYFRGRLAEAHHHVEEALDLYGQAIEKDPSHGESLFRRAYLLDLGGLDEESIQSYERAIKCAPANLAAVVNLGLLYEDTGQFRKAMRLYDFALRAHPYHPRAQLYRRDSAASLNMFFDEDMEKREDKRNQVLRTPITDFELSVRSRNCLAKMNIKTLGDLVKKTEAELLSYKNFGETSLNEIKEILKSKGLRLGMDREDLMEADLGEKPTEEKAPSAVEGVGDVTQKPITELELSVRCRRAMETLKIKVISDLTHRTEAELLALPNFGQTSLNEIKTKLEELGLSLKG